MKPNVVVIKDNLVDEIVRFGDDALEAETYFLQKCSELLSNWDKYTQEDKDAVIEQGYERFGNGSICLAWS